MVLNVCVFHFSLESSFLYGDILAPTTTRAPTVRLIFLFGSEADGGIVPVVLMLI
jgi:hypothetical protein